MLQISINKGDKTITDILVEEGESRPKKKPTPPPDNEPIYSKKDKTKRNALYEGVTNSAKTAITSTYSVPLTLALGFSSTTVALVASLPALAGAFSQLLSSKISMLAQSRQKFLVNTSIIENINYFLFLLLVAFSTSSPQLLVFLLVLDTILMNLKAPIWNAILADTVTDGNRGRYFGLRNMLTGGSSFLTTLLAGYILSKTTGISHLSGFVTIFGIALAAGLATTYFQTRFKDPAPQNFRVNAGNETLTEFFTDRKNSNFARFTKFISLFKLTVNIASPFFAVYMLQALNFTYWEFTIVTTASIISSFLSIKLWGKAIDKVGSRTILTISAALTPVVPFLWLFTTNVTSLALIEVLSGLIWAGFNLSASTFTLDAIPQKNRLQKYAYNHLLIGIGVFLGAMLGSQLLKLPPIMFGSAFLFVFFISGIARIAVIAFFIRKIHEEKIVSIGFGHKTFFRFITIRPKEGAIYDAIGKESKEINKKKPKPKK